MKGGSKVKPIKMLGLVTLGALMAMAFVGASSATAEETQLCTTDTNPCKNPTTSIHAVSIGQAILTSDVQIVKCDVEFSSSSVGDLHDPQIITGTFKYANCTKNCAAEEEGGPAEIKVSKTGVELASVTGEAEVGVTCPFINCFYNGENLEGLARGAKTANHANGEVILSGQKLHKVKGLFCPKEAFLGITIGPLSATYIKS
jgi:hypothetical protein